MINTDNNIREIFSQKLGNIETDVPDGLWENISQNLPSGSSAGATVAAKTIISKVWIAAGIAAAVAVGIVVWQKNASENPIVAPEPSSIQNPIESINNTQIPAIAENNFENKISGNSDFVPAVQPEDGDIQNPIQRDENTNELLLERNLNCQQEIDSSVPKEDLPVEKTDAAGDNKSAINQTPTNESKANELNAKFTFGTLDESSLEYKFVANYSSAQNYLWTFEDGTQLNGQSAIKQFDQEGDQRVVLTVTSTNGAEKSTSVLVGVYKSPEFFIPNVFTPNNDGQNDVFDPQEKSSNLQITKVIVLDDKGKVFESQGEKTWDGNDLQGNPCPAGNYYFLVRATDRNHQMMEKTGSIRLIR